MSRTPLALLAFALALGACLYDAGDRCGPDQVLDADGFCSCAAGAVLDPARRVCVRCAPNEVFKNGKCAAAPAAGAGAPCSASSACTTAGFTHCQQSARGGYCTATGCADDADCPEWFTCDRSMGPPFCRRPPEGFGKSCTGAADCAGTEATFCDTFSSKVCLVEGCDAGDPTACGRGLRCCDFTKLGLAKTLCVPPDECP